MKAASAPLGNIAHGTAAQSKDGKKQRRLARIAGFRPGRTRVGERRRRRRRERTVDDFAPSVELSRYVERSSIPRVAGEKDSERLWLNVRPFMLNRWLENSMRRVAAAMVGSESQMADRCFGVT